MKSKVIIVALILLIGWTFSQKRSDEKPQAVLHDQPPAQHRVQSHSDLVLSEPIAPAATASNPIVPEPESSGSELSSELQDLTKLRRANDFQMVPDTFEITFEGEDGTYQAEFKTTDGAVVHQWYAADDTLKIEEFNYGEHGIVKTWFSWGEDKITIVQFDKGSVGGQTGYYANNQPKFQRTWDDKNDVRIDF